MNTQEEIKNTIFNLISIKNVVIVPSISAKAEFLKTVYPHNIDLVVFSKTDDFDIAASAKIVFFGCYIETYSKNEHIVMDDILHSSQFAQPYTIRWTPESLAIFLSCWFSQGKFKTIGNNQGYRFNDPSLNPRLHWARRIMT
jgi:hypothetical protein